MKANGLPETHDEAVNILADRITELLDALKEQKERLIDEEQDDFTQVHFAKRTIQKWMHNNGGLPF